MDPSTLSLDPDPEFWPNLDPDPEFWPNFDPDPRLCYQFWKKNLKIISEKTTGIFLENTGKVPVPSKFFNYKKIMSLEEIVS